MLPIEELDAAIVGLIRTASYEVATERLITHWEAYLPCFPGLLGERIRSLPQPLWDSDPTLLVAMASSYRTPPVSNPFSALAYLDAARDALGLREDGQPDLAVQIALARCTALRDLGRFVDASLEVGVARQALARAGLSLLPRLELEAGTLFEEGACLAMMGRLDEARTALTRGIALGGDNGTVRGTLEALGWLALIDYLSGCLSAPLPHLARASAILLDLPATPVGAAASLIAQALVAVDEADERQAHGVVARLDEIVEGTAYVALAMLVSSIVAGSTGRPLEQLEILQGMQSAIQGWQRPVLARSLHDTERAFALIQLGSAGSARGAVSDLLAACESDERHVYCAARAASRLALHTGEYEAALAATLECRTLGDRHAPRALAHIDLLRAAAHNGLGDSTTAAETMDRALLQAARTGLRRHFTSLPHDRLGSMLDAAGARPQPPAALAVLDDLQDRFCPAITESISPLSARERLILARIVAGQTRQQISSQLSVSPNTIKTQVRSIYRKLGASNRHEAIDRAIKYGISV